jgi:hypothetical protein
VRTPVLFKPFTRRQLSGPSATPRARRDAEHPASSVASYSIKVSDMSGKTVATLKAFGQTVNLAGTGGQSYTVTVSANDKAGNKAIATAVVPVI